MTRDGPRLYYGFMATHAGKSWSEFLVSVPEPRLCFQKPPGAEGDCDESDSFCTAILEEVDVHAILRKDLRCLVPLRKRGRASGDVIAVGRARNSDLEVAHPRVSKFHCYFRCTRAGWLVTDANSRNGTTINGEHVPAYQSVLVRSGDVLALGSTVEAVFYEPPALYALMQSEDGLRKSG